MMKRFVVALLAAGMALSVAPSASAEEDCVAMTCEFAGLSVDSNVDVEHN